MRPLLSCVSEVSPEWCERVESLVISVRGLGGRLSTAPFVANFVGVPDPAVRRALESRGAEVRVVEGMAGNGMANKLRMLDLHETHSFDVLVALDCDVVVVDDFSAELPHDEVAAKPADFERLGDREWHRLYELVGVEPPGKAMRATSSGTPIPPYFNSGVISVPHRMCEPLKREWSACYGAVMEAVARDPDWLPRHMHWLAEQSALALAVLRAELPYRPLPVRLNFPTHARVRAADAGAPPAVLHYHAELDERGFLLRPRAAEAAEAANRFNAHRAAALGLSYPGLGERARADRLRRALSRRARGMLWRRQRLRSRWRDLVAGPDRMVSGAGRTEP